MQERTVGTDSVTPSEQDSLVQVKKRGMSSIKLTFALAVIVGVLVTSWSFGNLPAGIFALLALGCTVKMVLLSREHERVLREHQHLSLDHYELNEAKKKAADEWREERTRAVAELKRAQDDAQAARDELKKLEPRANAEARESVGKELVELTKDKLAALEAQAKAEKATCEALASRDRFESAARLHSVLSVLKYESAWWGGFRDEMHEKLVWSTVTHTAVIAVKGRDCRGIPIRVPSENSPKPFIATDANLGIEILIMRTPATGELNFTFTYVGKPSSHPARIKTDDPKGLVLVTDDDAAMMLIRATPAEAFRDIIIVQYLMRSLQTFVSYFRKLQAAPKKP